MNTLSKAIIQKLVSLNNTTNDTEDLFVYYYGMECFLNNMFAFSVIIIFSIITNCFFETIVFLIMFILLRHHEGGYHAPTNSLCLFFSITIGISVRLLLKCSTFILQYNYQLLILSFLICLFLAPIDSTKIKLNQKQKLQEKLFALGIIILAALLSLFIPTNYSISLISSITIVHLLLITAYIKHAAHHLHII